MACMAVPPDGLASLELLRAVRHGVDVPWLAPTLSPALVARPPQQHSHLHRYLVELHKALEPLWADHAEGEDVWPGNGDGATTSDSIAEAIELHGQSLAEDLPLNLLERLDSLDFETQKAAAHLIGNVLGACPLTAEASQRYVQSRPRFCELLLDGCRQACLALPCGLVLRSLSRCPLLVGCLLEAGTAQSLVRLMRYECFDISADAFMSLRELLLGPSLVHREPQQVLPQQPMQMHCHQQQLQLLAQQQRHETQRLVQISRQQEIKAVSASYLTAHFDEFFELYLALLECGEASDVEYVAQRQALTLLSQLLLDREFLQVMLRYVASERFLCVHMVLLRHSSAVIRAQTFHVLKVFVANPNKAPRVQLILHKNKGRLVEVLEGFRSRGLDGRGGLEDNRWAANEVVASDLEAVLGLLYSMVPP